MAKVNHEAILVKKALIASGVETPLQLSLHNIDNESRKKMIATHINKIMHLLNLDLNDDSLADSPLRIANMYINEVFLGLDYDNFPKITLIENKMKIDEMITVRNIALTSTCEHHFLIINGHATIAYIPHNKIIGLSKINRIVAFFSSRPQVQERLTKQIFIALQTLLGTNNVAVFIDAEHYCVKARGIHDANSATSTTSLGGLFKSSHSIRQEFLRYIRHL